MKTVPSFKQLLADGPVFAPCVYDCMSAKIAELKGFKAMCLSGGEVSASLIGNPDIGLMGFDEMLSVASHICDMSPLPMIVDIDTGFGNELNVMRTCERMVKAGAKAVHLEDQTFPKRCGQLKGKTVIERKEYMSKVRAAHYVLKDTDCLLIARTDSYATHGKEEAIARCLESLENGADITLAEAVSTREDIQEIGERVPGLKMFGMASKGASPNVTFHELTSWGYHLITFHCMLEGAMRGMEENASHSLADMSDVWGAEHSAQNIPGFFEIMGLHEKLELAKQFSKG